MVKSEALTIQRELFFLDDNYGEAVHIHFGDIRLDLTYEKLDALIAQIDKVLADDCFRSCRGAKAESRGLRAVMQKALAAAYKLKRRLIIFRDNAGKVSLSRMDPAVRIMIESR